MKRLLLLATALLPVIYGCAPRAQLDESGEVVRFYEAEDYSLIVEAASHNIVFADVQVVGWELDIASAACVREGCEPERDGYVLLVFKPVSGGYGERIVIPVSGGAPIKGRAVVNLEGSDTSHAAELEVLHDP